MSLNLRSELHHVMTPRRAMAAWGLFYVLLLAGLLSGLYIAAEHVRTKTVASGGIVLSTPYSKYMVGEPVSFSMTNKYNAPIFITNQCPSEPLAVYRQTGSKWTRIHSTVAAKDCQAENRQVSIPANSTVTVSLEPWLTMFTTSGNYRLVAVLDGYSDLPYVDFSVVTPNPVIAIAPQISALSKTGLTSGTTSIQGSSAGGSVGSTISLVTSPTPQPKPTPTPSPTPTPTQPVPKTISLHVNSAGNYDLTSISLNAGDSITFIYTAPINGEVRTHFSNIAPTTTTLSSLTLDSEFQSLTKKFTTQGSWSYKADDHSGNSGIITVH